MFAEHIVLHSLGLCVAFLLALPVIKLAARDPVVGYRLLLILLGASLALPLFTLPIAGRASSTGDRVLARLAVEPEPIERSKDASEGAANVPAVTSPPAIDPAPRKDAAPKSNAGETGVAGVTLAAKHEAERVATTKKVTPPAKSMRTRVRDAAVASSSWLRRATPYVILGWLLGALLVGRRLLLRILGTARIVRDATPVIDDRTLACWRIASAGRAIATNIELRRSEAVDAPACWGVVRPVILLPAVGGAPHDALTFALRHELVHLERRDPLAALAQAVLKTVYWFHPVAWWLSARIDRIRELACDQLVVANETQRKRYALALIDHAQAALAVPALASSAHSPTLLHWAPTLPQLRRRIEMLLNKSTPLPLRRRLFVLGGAASAVLLLLAAQGTVAATLLGDAPLSERLVACCPPKSTPPAVTPPAALFPAELPGQHSKPPKASKPKRVKKSKDTGIAQAPADPFGFAAPTLSTGFALAPNSIHSTNMIAFGPSGDDAMRDALIHVMTSSNDSDARVTAAKALGSRLSDQEVRRAFARVLRDEWEGSEVREAVGDELLRSNEFTPEAHEIIAALLKRDTGADESHDGADADEAREDNEVADESDGPSDEKDDDREDLAELGYVGGQSDLENLAELRGALSGDLSGLNVDAQQLDEETLESLSNLKEEFGGLNGITIDLGDAIKSLECDESCDEKCEDECDDAADEGDDDADEADEAAEDQHEALIDLLNLVREKDSKDDAKTLLHSLQQKKDKGEKSIDLRELLRVMQPTQAKTMMAPPTLPTVAGEDA